MSVLMVIQIWCHVEYNKYLCQVIKSIRQHRHYKSQQEHLIYSPIPTQDSIQPPAQFYCGLIAVAKMTGTCHSPPSINESKNTWSYTSVLSCVMPFKAE